MSIKVFSYSELLDELDHDLRHDFKLKPKLELGLILPNLLKLSTQKIIEQGYQESMKDWFNRNKISTPVPEFKSDINYVAIYRNHNHHRELLKIYPFGTETVLALIAYMIDRPISDNMSQTVMNRLLTRITDDWYNGLIINHLMKYLDPKRSAHDIKDVILKSLTTKPLETDPFNQYIKFSCKLNHLNHELAHRIKSHEKLETLSTSLAPIYTIRYNPNLKEYLFLTTLY